MKRVSGEFNNGYTKAIIDIMNAFETVCYDFGLNKKRWTNKLVTEFLRACLDNRQFLREDIDGFIRFNWQTQKFEYFRPEETK